MTRGEMLAELRKQSRADRRVKYDGHSRRPVALSMKRLRCRRSRRRSREFHRSYARANPGTVALRQWAPQRRKGRCGFLSRRFAPKAPPPASAAQPAESDV